MLTRQEIAAMLRVSPDHFRKRIEPRPDFPRPALRLSRKTVRWDDVDVHKWLGPEVCAGLGIAFQQAAAAPAPVEPTAAPKKTKNELVFQFRDIPKDVRDYMANKHKRAERRAAVEEHEFAITLTDVLCMYRAQQSRCAVSGIDFSMERVGSTFARPFSASIDRIDSKRGYVLGNVRLVCTCINMLMNEWGDSIYQRIVDHIKTSGDV